MVNNFFYCDYFLEISCRLCLFERSVSHAYAWVVSEINFLQTSDGFYNCGFVYKNRLISIS